MTASLTLYQQSATIIHSFVHHNGSLKSLCFASSTLHKPATFALVTETLKYRYVLMDIIVRVNQKLNSAQQLLTVTALSGAAPAVAAAAGKKPTITAAAAAAAVAAAASADINASSSIDEKLELHHCGLLVLVYDLLCGEGLPAFRSPNTNKQSINGSDGKKIQVVPKKDKFGLIQGLRWATKFTPQLKHTLSNMLHIYGKLQTVEQLLPVALRGANTTTRKHLRYIRINTLLSTPAAMRLQLASMGYTVVDHTQMLTMQPQPAATFDDTAAMTVQQQTHHLMVTSDTAATAAAAVVSATGKHYAFDPYIPHLLQFASSDNYITRSALVTSSHHLIIQDKSSCFPCVALQPTSGSIVIDACSAPGNKSSMLAAIMNNSGVVYAVERNRKRCAELEERMTAFGAAAVSVQHNSFLDIDSTNDPLLSQATHILLDPSCSGSGSINVDRLLGSAHSATYMQQQQKPTTGNISYNKPPTSKQVKAAAAAAVVAAAAAAAAKAADSLQSAADDAGEGAVVVAAAPVAAAAVDDSRSDRVKQLHELQVRLLTHALTFPRVHRISYSTCSVHEYENEAVIAAVLPAAVAAGYKLSSALPAWHRRGLLHSALTPGVRYDWHKRVVRVEQSEDQTGGFFVAVFSRTPPVAAAATTAHGSKKIAATIKVTAEAAAAIAVGPVKTTATPTVATATATATAGTAVPVVKKDNKRKRLRAAAAEEKAKAAKIEAAAA